MSRVLSGQYVSNDMAIVHWVTTTWIKNSEGPPTVVLQDRIGRKVVIRREGKIMCYVSMFASDGRKISTNWVREGKVHRTVLAFLQTNTTPLEYAV